MSLMRAGQMIVPIRKIPSHNGEYIDELYMGMPVEVLWEDRDNFVYVETAYGYRGYVAFDMLVEDTWDEKDLIKVSGGYVDITKGIPFDSGVLASVLKGSILKATGKKKAERLEVELPDGKLGWLRKHYIKHFVENKNIRSVIVETAESYLGAQFRWGGKSVLGMDVSGFISMIFLYHDVVLYRDIKLNDIEYEQIQYHELLPGDLIFFSEHPALYIGSDEFLHSSAVYFGVLRGSLNLRSELYKEEYSKDECIFARVRGVD